MEFPPDPSETLRRDALKLLDVAQRIPSSTIDRITAFARTHFGVPVCLVTLIEAERQVLLSKQGWQSSETPRKVAFCTYTILQSEVLVVPDARRDERFRGNPLVTSAPFIRFYAGAPLVYEEEVRLGSLCLIDQKPRSFSRGERAELAMLADHVVGVMTSWVLGLPEPDIEMALSI
jgi:GAF domain-containing protein